MRMKCALLALIVAAIAGACSGSAAVDESAEVVARVNEFQQNLLDEGELTFANYEVAMLATAECILEMGHDVRELELIDGRFYAFNVDDSGRDVDASVAACEAEFSGRIQSVWADHSAASPDEEAAFYQSIADCLRENGMSLSDSSPSSLSEALRTNNDLYSSCFDEALSTQR